MDASDIDVKAMGQFSMGGGNFTNFQFGGKDKGEKPKKSDFNAGNSGQDSSGGGSWQGQPGQSGIKNITALGIYLAVMVAALLAVKFTKRRK